MPELEDFIMMLLGMSEAFNDGVWAIGSETYNDYRPPGWPTAICALGHWGYSRDGAGWSALVEEHIGVDIKSILQVRIEQGQQRADRRCRLHGAQSYAPHPDERYQALTSVGGLPICQQTFERTGRMMLR